MNKLFYISVHDLYIEYPSTMAGILIFSEVIFLFVLLFFLTKILILIYSDHQSYKNRVIKRLMMDPR